MDRSEWDKEQAKRARDLIADGLDPASAMRTATKLTGMIFGPRPAAPPSDPTKPSRWAVVKLGFSLWRNRNMRFSQVAFFKALLAAFAAASAAYGIAYQDGLINAAEAMSIGWQFISVLAATLIKPDPVAAKSEALK